MRKKKKNEFCVGICLEEYFIISQLWYVVCVPFVFVTMFCSKRIILWIWFYFFFKSQYQQFINQRTIWWQDCDCWWSSQEEKHQRFALKIIIWFFFFKFKIEKDGVSIITSNLFFRCVFVFIYILLFFLNRGRGTHKNEKALHTHKD